MEEHPLPTHHVQIKKLRSLLAIVENSVKGGNNFLFKNLYVDEDGKEMDILEDGKDSCAAFVSWILLTLELIKHPHATVISTEKDLLASGWHETEELKPGSVLIWQGQTGEMLGEGNVLHTHMGFYLGNDEAISNDSQNTGFPQRHHITYNDTRKVEKIYWHPELDNG